MMVLAGHKRAIYCDAWMKWNFSRIGLDRLQDGMDRVEDTGNVLIVETDWRVLAILDNDVFGMVVACAKTANEALKMLVEYELG